MIKLYYILFHGCDHKFNILTDHYVHSFYGDYKIITSQCEKCGRLSNHKIS